MSAIPDETAGRDDEPTQQTIIHLPAQDTYLLQFNFRGTRQPGGSWLFTDHRGRFHGYFQNPLAFRHWVWTVLCGASEPTNGHPVYYFRGDAPAAPEGGEHEPA